jgi:hypothetical protein
VLNNLATEIFYLINRKATMFSIVEHFWTIAAGKITDAEKAPVYYKVLFVGRLAVK